MKSAHNGNVALSRARANFESSVARAKGETSDRSGIRGRTVASRNSPGARRAPGSDRRRGICGRLIDLSDLLQDFRLDPRTLVDTDVRDGMIPSQVEIYDLAV